MPDTPNLQEIIIEAIFDKKGRKIAIIDLSSFESAPTSKLIICQGNSTAQVSALADNIRDSVQKISGIKPNHYEGYRNCQWIIVDYGSVMVHIFLPVFREFYSLESLWNDAPTELIPDID